MIGAPSVTASIGAFGEIDTYNFVVKQAGKIRTETEGSIDTVMSLFGPNDNTKFIAQDDDSGGRLQARIVATLKPGVYTLRVRHFSNKKTGSYKIGVYTA
jgi:tyrosinase